MESNNFIKYREQLPALKKSIYLNTGGSGPLPIPILEEIKSTYEYLATEGQILIPVVNNMKAKAEKVRNTIASFLGASPEEISFTRCITEGINTIAYAMDLQRGDEVIISDQENPAFILPFLNLVHIKGIKVKKLKIENSIEKIIQNLKEIINTKTKLIALSHVTHVSGIQLPVTEICNIAHSMGILVAVDGAQACGQVDVNVKLLGCDFYLMTCHKWLCGPEGVGAMYIDEKTLGKIRPPFTGVGAQESFDFENDIIVFHDNAKKFEFGGRHLPLYHAMGKAIEFNAQIGINNIVKRSRELAENLRYRLKGLKGLNIISPENKELSTGIFTFFIENADHELIVRRAAEKNIIIQWRTIDLIKKTKGIRVSLAWFITDEEIETLTDFIEKTIKG